MNVPQNLDNALPGDVRSSLEKYAAGMSACRISYLEKRSGTIEPADYRSRRYSEYFDNGRLYLRFQAFPDSRCREPYIHEAAFDGKFFWTGSPNVEDTENPVTLAKHEASDVLDPSHRDTLMQWSYLDAAGLYAPASMADMCRRANVQSLVLWCLGESDHTKVEEIGKSLKVTVRVVDPVLSKVRQIDLGSAIKEMDALEISQSEQEERINILKKMRELEPIRTISFVHDPDRGYGVVQREERNAEGRLIAATEATQWVYYSQVDVWLPQKSKISYSTNPDELIEFSDRPCWIVSTELEDISFGGQQDIEYTLDRRAEYLQPGSFLVDRTTAEAHARPGRQLMYTRAVDGTLMRGIRLK